MGWLTRLLVGGVDLGPSACGALRYASFLADFYHAALDVLHVIPRAAGDERWVVRQDAFRLLHRTNKLRHLLDDAPFHSAKRALVHVSIADPVAAFAAAVEREAHELLLVGDGFPSAKLTQLQSLVPGRVMIVRADVVVPTADPMHHGPATATAFGEPIGLGAS